MAKGRYEQMETVVRHLRTIAELCKKMTTGNVAHERARLSGMISSQAKFLQGRIELAREDGIYGDYNRGYRAGIEAAMACIVPDGNPMVALEKMRALAPDEEGSDG